MGLIQNPVSGKTIEMEILDQKRAMTAMHNGLKTSFEKLFKTIWENPIFTPQQIMNGYANDAVLLFIVSGKTGELLHAADPSYIPPTIPERYTFTLNQDGTVIITDSQA